DVCVERIGIKEVVVAIAQTDGLTVSEVMVDLGYCVVAVLLRTAWKEKRSRDAVAIVNCRVRIKREHLLHSWIEWHAIWVVCARGCDVTRHGLLRTSRIDIGVVEHSSFECGSRYN